MIFCTHSKGFDLRLMNLFSKTLKIISEEIPYSVIPGSKIELFVLITDLIIFTSRGLVTLKFIISNEML